MFASFDHNSINKESLKDLSKLDFSKKGTRRICLHSDESSILQVMMIEFLPYTFYDFHCHPNSDEFVMLFKGQVEYNFKNKENCILSMDDIKSIIIPQYTFHSVLSGLNGAIIIEVSKGPYSQSSTQYFN